MWRRAANDTQGRLHAPLGGRRREPGLKVPEPCGEAGRYRVWRVSWRAAACLFRATLKCSFKCFRTRGELAALTCAIGRLHPHACVQSRCDAWRGRASEEPAQFYRLCRRGPSPRGGRRRGANRVQNHRSSSAGSTRSSAQGVKRANARFCDIGDARPGDSRLWSRRLRRAKWRSRRRRTSRKGIAPRRPRGEMSTFLM